MGEIKLTKNELRNQQRHLGQLQKYLPTLQLKKAMLQLEVHQARIEIVECERGYATESEKVYHFSPLLTQKTSIDPQAAAKVQEVNRRYENVAGVEVPYFESVKFEKIEYSLFDTPVWFDTVIQSLQKLAEAKVRVDVAREKKAALEEELRQVSIRVNLFEKILIPRAKKNIKKIKVFLGDQELAAVSRAKVAKTIIERSR
jgi:V/A-type H+-transporting ATPase subunit D